MAFAADPDFTHRAAYAQALSFAGVTGAPAWSDLTDEQRENVRRANREHSAFMNDLGEAIRTGGALPMPRLSIDHTERAALLRIRTLLDAMSLGTRTRINLWCIDAGLMRTGCLLRLVMWLWKWRCGRRGRRGIDYLAMHLANKSPDLAEQLWRQTMDHLVDGVDLTDPTSAGGFNADELSRFAGVLQQIAGG